MWWRFPCGILSWRGGWQGTVVLKFMAVRTLPRIGGAYWFCNPMAAIMNTPTLNDPTWPEQRVVIVQDRWGHFIPETVAPQWFWLSHIRRPMSPLKYKQGEIKTQNVKIVKTEPHWCHQRIPEPMHLFYQHMTKRFSLCYMAEGKSLIQLFRKRQV